MANSVTILDPSGTPREIPLAQRDAALKAGGKLAVKMIDPHGTQRWIPQDQREQALASGGKLSTPAPSSPAALDLTNTIDPKTGTGYGLYKMTAPDGTEKDVPYNKVIDASNAGYKTTQQERERYASDRVAELKKQKPQFTEGDLRSMELPQVGVVTITSGEGQYQMKDKSGKVVPVSYGHVREALDQGYLFSDKAGLQQFARDEAADPKAQQERKNLEFQVSHPLSTENNPFFQGAHDELAQVLTAFDKLPTSKAETEAQLRAATPHTGFAQNAGAVGEQLIELLAVPETDFAKAAKVPKLAKIGIKIVEQGFRAAGEQGAQTYVHSGGDVEQTKKAAEYGGVGGVATSMVPEVFGASRKFTKNVLRNRLNIDELQTEKVISETQKANEKIAKQAEDVHADNVDKIREARNSGNEADAARLEHQDVVDRQQAIEAKRTNLTDAVRRTRQAIAQRVQAINDAAKAYFKTGFEDVKATLDAPDPETGEIHTVPYADLDSDVEDVEKEIKGSKENVKIFQDIGRKAQGIGDTGADEEELVMMSPEERKAAMQLPSAKYSELDGYYQEAGRAIGNPSTLPDVRQALVKFRELLGKRMQDLADEVDPAVGKQHALLRRQYKQYAEGFKDYTGPSGSASPVAKGLLAKDTFNATKPYEGLEPEEAKRAKGLLVGDTTKPETQFVGKEITGPDGETQPAWKYRKQTHQLIEHMRNMQAGLDALPKPEKLEAETTASAEKLAKARTTSRTAAKPKLEQEPPLETETPQTLGAKKVKALRDAGHSLSKFGTWMAVMGPVGALATFLRTGDPKKAAEGGLAGVGAGLVTPYMLSKLLDNPAVVKSLTTVTRKDLQLLSSLPTDQRAGVEKAIQQLSDEAVKTRKLKAAQIPWYRIIGGTAAKLTTQSTPEAPASGESEQEIEKDLNDMQQQVSQ